MSISFFELPGSLKGDRLSHAGTAEPLRVAPPKAVAYLVELQPAFGHDSCRPRTVPFRRAVRDGDGWHPIHVRTDWLEAEGLPRLRQIADTENKAMPALCPRIKLTLTPNPLPESDRVAGEGSLDQVRRDFEALEALGASHVLLDTFTGDLEATRNHETHWEMLTVTAEQILDLPKNTVR